jgi:hypothetical protein
MGGPYGSGPSCGGGGVGGGGTVNEFDSVLLLPNRLSGPGIINAPLGDYARRTGRSHGSAQAIRQRRTLAKAV